MEFKGTKGEFVIKTKSNSFDEMVLKTESRRLCIWLFLSNENPEKITYEEEGKVLYETGRSINGSLEATANMILFKSAYKMLEAIQEFCERVEKGEVRSTKTYNKFKKLIKEATEVNNE